MSSSVAHLKQQAANKAVAFIESGMVLGLGEGSTALLALYRLGEIIAAGEISDVVGIPASQRIENEARRLNIPLTTLAEHPVIDLTIDGADEVDPDLNLVKGGGGALLREKIVAQATLREIIIVDDSKLVDRLGTQWAIPVEVVPFGWQSQAQFLESLGAEVVLRRKDDEIVKTDQGNIILDCNFGPIDDAYELGRCIKARAGIVEHGLFLDLTSDVIVASPDGVRHLQRA